MRIALLFAFLGILAGCRGDSSLESKQALPRASQIAESPHVQSLAYLIDWERLDGLTGKRAATPYLRKACHRLEIANREGIAVQDLILAAHQRNGVEGTKRAEAVKISLLENHALLADMGCFDDAGLAKLERGKAPTITKGEQTGEIATVDHVLPRSVVPELDCRLYNLRFMAESLNNAKGAEIDDRGFTLANRWHEVGLLSKAGLKAVESVSQSH